MASIRDKRPALIRGDTALIPIGLEAKDGYAIVDIGDKDLDRYKWYLSANKYPTTRIEKKHIKMHHFIIDRPIGKSIDHINLNPVDNRKANLRVCTHAENMRNVAMRHNNKSGYKGVQIYGKRFRAVIRVDNKNHHIGMYATALEAARAYDEKAVVLHGDFARLNNG